MATTPSQRGLGFPAVSEPRSFDLRSLQITVQQVRERLRVIDAAVSTLQNVTASNQLTTTVAQLQQQANQLQIRLTALENSLGADDTVTLAADTDMPVGAAVVPSGATGCRMVDPNDPEAVFACVGLVTKAVVQGQAAVIQRRGSFSLPGSGFEEGRAVYASIGGDLTQQPTYGAAAVPVGIATGEGTVYVTAGGPALLALGLDDNAYERFMYASVELVSDAIALAAQVDAAANGLIVKTADGLVESRVLQGTTNRVTVTNGDGVAGNPVVDISAAYAGQATIATLGTVTLGAWQATPVGIAFGGSGQVTANAALNAFLPTQSGHAGEALFTNGTDTAWGTVALGTVTSVGVTGNNGIGVSGSPITSSGTITLSLGAITPSSVAASGTVSGSNLSGTNTGDQTITLTGDVTGSGTGSFAATLATVNSNVGSFGSSTAIPTLTVNAKGLITAVSTNAVVAPAGTLTGTTLAANVVSSSLTSLGTIATGVWQGTAVGAAYGGTGQSSYAVGDLLYASASTTLSKLAGVATGNALISGGIATAPSWGKIDLTTHVTGTLPVANGGTGITSLGTGVATWLGTPSSANLRAAMTDETGTGALVFADTPTLVTPVIGAATGTSVNLSSTATASALIPTGSSVPANGMYLSSANTLDLATASTNRMRIDSGGNVGIGRAPSTFIDAQNSGLAVFRLRGGTSTNQGAAFYATGASDVTACAFGQRSAIFGGTPGSDSTFYSAGTLSLGANATEVVFLATNGSTGFGAAPAGGGTYKVEINGALSVNSTTMIRTASAFTNGAAAATGTLTNAPAAGNPTKWVPINDAGTTRYIPTW